MSLMIKNKLTWEDNSIRILGSDKNDCFTNVLNISLTLKYYKYEKNLSDMLADYSYYKCRL